MKKAISWIPSQVRRAKRVLVFCVLGLALQCFAGIRPSLAATDCSKATTDMSKDDCEALVTLFNSTGGLGWRNNFGWDVDNKPCSWYGVTCRDWHVVRLDLSFNNLVGTVPMSLSYLTYPEQIRLNGNKLTGALPLYFGSSWPYDDWITLRELDLSDNQLSGSIPIGLGDLDNLEILRLNDNQFSGSIPGITQGTLPKLRELSQYNKIPAPVGAAVRWALRRRSAASDGSLMMRGEAEGTTP